MKFHNNIPISGWSFSNFNKDKISIFDRLLEIFKELLTYTSGDFDEAIDWLKELDKEYELTTDDYSIEDFINDLLKRGFISSEISTSSNKELLKITSKMEKALRKFALKKIFGQIKNQNKGTTNLNHLDLMMEIYQTLKVLNLVILWIKLFLAKA